MAERHRPIMLVSAVASREAEAKCFCETFGYEYCPPEKLPDPEKNITYILNFNLQRVEILSWVVRRPGPVFVDFDSAKNTYRRKFGGGRSELLAKAIGLKKGVSALRVVDATAGLAQDALVLASLGCTVTLYERNPVVHCLLADGLHRAQASGKDELNLLSARLDLRFGPAKFSGAADVAYLDPMFPNTKSHRRVKKEMTAFKAIVGGDSDGAELLNAALQSPVKRVVVKRPRLAEDLGHLPPSYRIMGKSSRFDIYAKQSLRNRL